MRHLSDLSAKTLAWAVATFAAALAGCGSGSNDATVTVQGDVPIAYVMRSTAMTMNPTNAAPSAPGGDLMIREKSSPSAPEHNVTAQFTRDANGVANGDASDPEVSYDGKRIVFAMKCPATNPGTIEGQPACTGHWNIWEYDMTTGGFTAGTFRRITASTTDDDVDPAYLPGSKGFVFASNRQIKSKTVMNGNTYYALDEYERERVFNLYTMGVDGSAITQISFNASHDRNPVVRPDGMIMFSRWEHTGPRNRFAVFRVKPDGTDMFVLYGAHSPGNSFLHPRDMDPKGKYSGFIASDLMALSRTQEGGSLMFIDAANYSEQDTPASKLVPAVGGQTEVTAQALNQDRGLSKYGRITTPFPLWDGTDRVLLAYRPCEVTRSGTVIPCANLTAAELARLNDPTLTNEQRALDAVKDNAPAAYAIYMYNPANQTFQGVAVPPSGFMYTDPIALQSRDEPIVKEPTSVDTTLAAQNLGVLEVRSVYDTDGLHRMDAAVLAAADVGLNCPADIIPQTTPRDTNDTRSSIANLALLKDPANAAYGCAPARFVRAIRSVAPAAGSTGMREAIGETDFEPQQILGYAPIQPDGSFKLKVPADTPLALVVTDAKGRGLQTHLNWIQVRPGERRTCDGCHSPRRGASINDAAMADTLPAALKPSMTSQHESGQVMSSLAVKVFPDAANLNPDLVFTDIWADTTQTGVTAKPDITVKYVGNTNAADNLLTSAPTNGLINYKDHIAPIWTRDRGANTCTTCHADATKLDLSATITGTGRVQSYEELVLGDPLFDANGLPVTRLEDGEPVIVRGPALVETDAGNAQGLARASRLGEILWGETLKASADALAAHPGPTAGAPDHAAMLTRAELRLVTEWMDLGGQYYNDLGANGSPVQVSTLSQDTFAASVYPILQANCAICHQPAGNSGAAQTAGTFVKSRFVLAGSLEGDFNVTLTMINDVCNAASNPLLMRPSTIPHPSGATGQTTALLPVGSANYTTIANWIATGCR